MYYYKMYIVWPLLVIAYRCWIKLVWISQYFFITYLYWLQHHFNGNWVWKGEMETLRVTCRGKERTPIILINMEIQMNMVHLCCESICSIAKLKKLWEWTVYLGVQKGERHHKRTTSRLNKLISLVFSVHCIL